MYKRYRLITDCLCLVSIYVGLCVCVGFFCFKQKSAYEMRISDWSSDVCSSDLSAPKRSEAVAQRPAHAVRLEIRIAASDVGPAAIQQEWVGRRRGAGADIHDIILEIGRASCRERVCQYV